MDHLSTESDEDGRGRSGPDATLGEDVVLLLVHGIGQQRPGSVVNDVGNAVLEWFQARLEGTGRRVEVGHALLKPHARGAAEAASITLVIRGIRGEPDRRLTLVESLWAEEFDPPGFLGVLRWALGPGTWLVFQHVVTWPIRALRTRPFRARRPNRAHWAIAGLSGVVALFVLALPLQLLGIALALLRLVPLAVVRTPVEAIVVGLSQFLGDSYLFARNPLVRRALADRVRRDLDRLPIQGARVAVLAHSQGAAVALEMLEGHPSPPPLVTYGAGIRKLHELVNRHGDASVPAIFRILWAVAACWIVALVGAVVNVRRVVHGDMAPDPWAGMSWLVLFALCITGWVLGITALERRALIDRRILRRIRRLVRRQAAWLDVFATHDLVPAGSLLANATYEANANGHWRSRKTASLDSHEVMNERRFVTDHTSYWGNPDGFIDPVLRWLSTALERPWLSLPVRPQPAGCARGPRVRVPAALRVALVIGAIALGWRASETWRGLVPSASAAITFVLEQFPAFAQSRLSFFDPLVAATYDAGTFLLVVALHGVLAALYEALVPGSIWRITNHDIALRPPVSWYGWAKAFAGTAGYLALFGMAAVALALAVQRASYAPLLDVPVQVLLTIHRWLT